MKFIQKVFFRLRERTSTIFLNRARKVYWSLQGMQIGHGVNLPKFFITWPHQVKIGMNSNLEDGIYFKFDGVWSPGPKICIGNNCFLGAHSELNIRQGISIGDNCLIASGCKFIDHDHGFAKRDVSINIQGDGAEVPITLENDVWLGVNVVILKGVTIGKGAIIGAGSVVTKSIPPYEIWAGIPARKIFERPA